MSRGKRNRQQGHNWENKAIRIFAEVFEIETLNKTNHDTFQLASSRAVSRTNDALKKDWSWTDRAPKWMQNLAVQCKKYLLPKSNGKKDIRDFASIRVDVKPLFELIENCSEEEDPILITRVTRDAGKLEREVSLIVSMEYHDFLNLIWKLNDKHSSL